MHFDKNSPLAVRMRPLNLDEFVGQEHVLAPGKILYRAVKSAKIGSIILWGPPGSGKTSLGLIVSSELGADFEYLNAAFSSTPDLKKIIKEAGKKLHKEGKKTVVFVDEIHRFNKLQQEALVPDTEAANIILVGATIYNPYYSIIPSLISRSIMAGFKPLKKEDIINILKRALLDEKRGLGSFKVRITNKALEYIAVNSNGDARTALTALELSAFGSEPREGFIVIDFETARDSISKDTYYDRKGDYHYDTVSAFIKSIRGSDVDSALYWLAKMLKGGEDPRFIARRLIILASEDIGNANPFALALAVNCFTAVDFIGMPEASLVLAQTVIYLASSVKSNSAALAIGGAMRSLEEEPDIQPPAHLKTHSKDYKYPHASGGYVKQDYGVKRQYYFPKEAGEEKKIKDFLNGLKDV